VVSRSESTHLTVRGFYEVVSAARNAGTRSESTHLTVRVPAELAARVRELADRNGGNVSAEVRAALERHVEAES
jgi:predicted HicB family RNase H-like nuclease